MKLYIIPVKNHGRTVALRTLKSYEAIREKYKQIDQLEREIKEIINDQNKEIDERRDVK